MATSRARGINRMQRCMKCGERFRTSKLLKNHECTSDTDSDGEGTSTKKSKIPTTVPSGGQGSKVLKTPTTSGVKLVQCKYCSARFTNETTLKAHVRMHTGEMPYSCKPCKIKFQLPNELKMHKKYHEDNIDRPFKCTKCVASFNCGTNLQTHLKMQHDGNQNNLCKECDGLIVPHCKHICSHKMRSSSADWTVVDSSESLTPQSTKKNKSAVDFTPQSCATVRGKRSTQSALSRSSDEKPCCYCDASFVNSTELKIHQSAHLLKDDTKCQDCKKSFSTAKELQKHVSEHDGVNLTHTCSNCTVSYANATRFRMHLCNRYLKLKCAECGELRFRNDDEMKAHLKSEHCSAAGDVSDVVEVDVESAEEERSKNLPNESADIGSVKYSSVLLSASVSSRPPEFSRKKRLSRSVGQDDECGMRCGECGERFATDFELNEHFRLKHPVIFKCALCEDRFPCERSLSNHMAAKHKQSASPINVTRTRRSSASVSSPAQSTSRVSRTCTRKQLKNQSCVTVQCTECDANCVDSSELDVHLKTVHSIFSCNKCDQRFNSYYKLFVHEGVHKMDETICTNCGPRCACKSKKKKSIDTLPDTEKSSSGKLKHKRKSVEHSSGDKRTRSTRIRQLQQERHEKKKENTRSTRSSKNRIMESSSCPVCKKVYSSISLVQLHLKNVHRLAFQSCKVCNKFLRLQGDESGDLVCDSCNSRDDRSSSPYTDDKISNDNFFENSSNGSDDDDEDAVTNSSVIGSKKLPIDTVSESGLPTFLTDAKKMSVCSEVVVKMDEASLSRPVINDTEPSKSANESDDIKIEHKENIKQLEPTDDVEKLSSSKYFLSAEGSEPCYDNFLDDIPDYYDDDHDSCMQDNEKTEQVKPQPQPQAVSSSTTDDAIRVPNDVDSANNNDCDEDKCGASPAKTEATTSNATCGQMADDSDSSELEELIASIFPIILADFNVPNCTSTAEYLNSLLLELGLEVTTIPGNSYASLKANCETLFIASFGREGVSQILSKFSLEEALKKMVVSTD